MWEETSLEARLRNSKFIIMAATDCKEIDANAENKCTMDLRGKPVVQHVLDELLDLDVKNIYIIGPEKTLKRKLPYDSRVEVVQQSTNFSGNILAIAKNIRFNDNEIAVLLDGDSPFFNKDALFYSLNNFNGCDISKSFVPSATMESYRDLMREIRYFYFQETTTKAGCIVLAKPNKIDISRLYNIFQDLYDKRNASQFMTAAKIFWYIFNNFEKKEIFWAAKIFASKWSIEGDFRLGKKLFKPISIKEVEGFVAKYLGVGKAKAQINPYAEIAIDVDKPEIDLPLYEKNFDESKRRIKREYDFFENIKELHKNHPELFMTMLDSPNSISEVLEKKIIKDKFRGYEPVIEEIKKRAGAYMKQDLTTFRKKLKKFVELTAGMNYEKPK